MMNNVCTCFLLALALGADAAPMNVMRSPSALRPGSPTHEGTMYGCVYSSTPSFRVTCPGQANTVCCCLGGCFGEYWRFVFDYVYINLFIFLLEILNWHFWGASNFKNQKKPHGRLIERHDESTSRILQEDLVRIRSQGLSQLSGAFVVAGCKPNWKRDTFVAQGSHCSQPLFTLKSKPWSQEKVRKVQS